MPDSFSATGRRGLFVAAMVIPLALLVGIGFMTHTASENLAREQESLHRLTGLRSQTAALLTAMVDQETGQRGYILAQNPMFLEPYEHAVRALPGLRRSLTSSITEPASRRLHAALEKSVEARMAFATQTVELQRSGEHERSVAKVATGEGKELMDQVRADAAALEARFDELTKAAEDEYAALVRWNELISWGMVAVDGCFMALLILLLVRLRRAQQFLHVCAWSKAVEYEGEWVSFETYLSRRFGISISHGISPVEAEKMMEAMHAELPAAAARRGG